jgi:hypothetical protein
MRRRLHASSLLAACLLVAGCATQNIVSTCDEPRVPYSPHVVLVLMPYEYGGAKGKLSERASDLALFMQLETLRAGLGHKTFGVTLLLPRASGDAACDVAEVEQKLTGKRENVTGSKIEPYQDLVTWWGRVYEEGGVLYVQNHLRLAERAARQFVHTKRSSEWEFPFSGTVPLRSVSFPPRKVTPELLESWRRALADATVVRDAPEPTARAVARLRHDTPVNYSFERDATRPGWVITEQPDGRTGYLQLGEKAGQGTLLPEIHFLQGLIGFLQSFRPKAQTFSELERVVQAFEAYRADEDPARGRGPVLLSTMLQAYVELDYGSRQGDPAAVARARLAFDALTRAVPLNSDVRNLAALGRIVACCDIEEPEAVQLEIEHALIRAVVADPTNDAAAGNLQNYYAYLATARIKGPFDRSAVAVKQRLLREFQEASQKR